MDFCTRGFTYPWGPATWRQRLRMFAWGGRAGQREGFALQDARQGAWLGLVGGMSGAAAQRPDFSTSTRTR